MKPEFDPKELKTLSDILALVLEEQPGQAATALEALRTRARRNAITGGALKNLFVAIAPNPPPKAAPRARASRATGAAGGADMQAARTRISQLTADVNKLDLDLRGASARIEALRSELHQTRKARAEAQQALLAAEGRTPKRLLLLLSALGGLVIGVAVTSTVTLIGHGERQPTDNSIYLHTEGDGSGR
ncbi:hypothetical protein [Rhizosaccharibacter radicis]|uniref:DUF3618 domain-containing protein n=1 Tax=Rhizosaccharibacter radicis TaxID=2782605 RepID=A0ABT1VXR3_9PROT|nr:hypothetical protein [Acetobacteraceae bacterium KSS12]